MRFAKLLSAVMALTLPGQVLASSTGSRRILSMGCDLPNTICYVNISEDPVGPPNCRGNSIRWNTENAPNGKNIFSLLTAAYLAGKPVSIEIDDAACYAYKTQFPTLLWLFI